jgi:hypothetical protein
MHANDQPPCGDLVPIPTPKQRAANHRALSKLHAGNRFRAYVEVLQGNRMMSDFMAAAGLGLTGVGVRETMTIDYKPGEEVNAARVSKAMDSMIKASNRERTDFKILSYKVLRVTLLPNDQAVPAENQDSTH